MTPRARDGERDVTDREHERDCEPERSSSLRWPKRAARFLGDLKDWLAANNAVIMAVLCLIIAAKLIGDGITGLAG